MKKICIGIIGLGVGEQHAVAFQSDPRCQVAMLCDLSPSKLQTAHKRFPGSVLTQNADDIISNNSIDVVSIASYDNDHASQVIKTLKSGKHVFVEKPLCQTSGELRKIKDAWLANSKKSKIICNFVLRKAPLYLWLKKRIHEGGFGQIYAIDGEYLYGRIEKITHGWRKDITNYSVIKGGGIHLIDLILWLSGQRPSRIFVKGNRICTQKTLFKYNDYVTTVMVSPSDTIWRITSNFGCVHKHQHILKIFGTKASFIYDDAGPRLYHNRNAKTSPQSINLPSLPPDKGVLIPDLINAIVSQKKLTTDTQLIFDGMQITLAAEQSEKNRREESIEYL